jgi:hypothetical protein
MPGGKAVITITPVAGEFWQFTLSVADSIPLTGSVIDSVVWTVATAGVPPHCRGEIEFTNEFDYASPAAVVYTASAAVKFSDGSVDTAVAKFNVPHGVN